MATFIASDGVRLFYERRGRGPRVYVCGGGPANDHRYMAEDLAALGDEFEFVFVDYRGSGQSETAPGSAYSIARLAADLDELRVSLGDDKVVVLGHSMGGLVAQWFALTYPEDCDRIVLAGTFPATVPRTMLPPLLRALGWARTRKMFTRGLWWLAAFSWRRRSEIKRRRLYAIWSTWQEGTPAHRFREVEREVRLGLPLHNDNVQALQREFRSLSLIDRLSTIPCPVLVLYGDRDAGAVWGARVFAEHVPDVRIVALPGIGHDPFFEALNASADALRSFLATPRQR